MLYDLDMPSLTAKLIDGKTYYYARYCQRINGKPKIVRQVYLGKVEDLVAGATQTRRPPQPLETEVAAFGDVAALFDIARQLDLGALLDAHLPAKRAQGLSPGQYLLLAAINRAVAPTSKLQMAHWYQQTLLTRLLPADPAWLSSQSFWNHMDPITEAHIQNFEQQLTRRLQERFQLDLQALIYDGTNFFSYINTRNPAQLPQRGHNKQKRGDLRQISLGLLVSADFHVPLFHKVYAGNLVDAVEFRSITQELATHYRQLADTCQHITLVFDKGNNSQEAFQTLQATPFHFVGSLVPSQHSDLLRVPRRQFHPLDCPGRLDGVAAYRTRKRVLGKDYTVLVTFNDKLLEGQLQGLAAHLSKARQKLQALQKQLQRRRQGQVRGGKAPTEASLQKQLRQILSAQWVATVLKAELRTTASGLDLLYHTDTTALARLTRTQLGKTLLFTDNDSWTDEQIVLAYRSQSHIEDAFKQMKNPHFLGWSPMYHWTDSKIRVHAFYCVLALLLTSLLQRTLAQKGEPLSINRLLEELGGIRETLVLYPRQQGQKKFPSTSCLTHRNPLQSRLFQLLNLERYQPTYS